MMMNVEAIQWQNDELQLLDQRLLPSQEVYLTYRDAASVAEAITQLVVRGAPAIGITAAYGCVLAAQQAPQSSVAETKAWIRQQMQILQCARPTAVNLKWALDEMEQVLKRSNETFDEHLLSKALEIHAADITSNQMMGEYGAALLGDEVNVLTHCNTGSLATGGYGTALGVIRTAFRQGQLKRVFAGETRPWLQGSRLTAWELEQDGINCELVIEGAVASLFKAGMADWLIVGSDRIAANGDVANKIGTYSAALHAKKHGAKVMVVAPLSTIDLNTSKGSKIPIEQRDATEILTFSGERVAANEASAWNPVFDITPHKLIDAIVTEKGVASAPFKPSIRHLFEAD